MTKSNRRPIVTRFEKFALLLVLLILLCVVAYQRGCYVVSVEDKMEWRE